MSAEVMEEKQRIIPETWAMEAPEVLGALGVNVEQGLAILVVITINTTIGFLTE